MHASGLANDREGRKTDMAARMRTFTAYVEWDEATRLYAGVVPGIPGAHTQGASLDELHQNLEEVLELCLEALSG